MNKIVALNQHIREFCVSDSRIKPATDYVFVEHVVQIHILSNVPQKIKERIIFKPVVIIHKFSGRHNAGDLRTDFFYVVIHIFFGNYFPLSRRTRISDSSGGTATQKDWLMSGIRKTLCHAQRRIMPKMKAVGGRICSPIKSYGISVKHFL